MLIFTANGEVLLLSKESGSDRSAITKRVTEAELASFIKQALRSKKRLEIARHYYTINGGIAQMGERLVRNQ